MKRGQAVIDSMLVLVASLGMLAVLVPAYRSAFDLVTTARERSLSVAAASRLGQALLLAQSLGPGSTLSGEVALPSSCGVGADALQGLAVACTEPAGYSVSVPHSDRVGVSGLCSGSCHYDVMHDSDDGIFLEFS
jgi:hypothetical protein